LTHGLSAWIFFVHDRKASIAAIGGKRSKTMDDLDKLKQRISSMVAELKQDYGDLRVKANLAKLEARDELKDMEKKLNKLEAKAKQLGGATAEASKDIGAAAKLLGEEIREGLKNIAKRF